MPDGIVGSAILERKARRVLWVNPDETMCRLSRDRKRFGSQGNRGRFTISAHALQGILSRLLWRIANSPGCSSIEKRRNGNLFVVRQCKRYLNIVFLIVERITGHVRQIERGFNHRVGS